jgi:Fe-S-cluster containining protein
MPSDDSLASGRRAINLLLSKMPTLNKPSNDRLIQLTSKRGMSEADFAEMIGQLDQRRAQFLVADEEIGLYAETLAESVGRDRSSLLPDCQTCGACCAFFHQIVVLDSDPTPRRLTWAVWNDEAIAGPKTHWLRREALEGCCVAFKGRVGGHASCAIYELRPMSCRAFEAGSDRCRAVRRAYGLEPPLSEDERLEQTRRIQPEASGDWSRVEALEGRDPSSFSQRERAKLLVEMIAYHRARLAEVASEAEHLHALLAEKGSVRPAATAAHHVNAINEEVRVVASIIKPSSLFSLDDVESWDDATMEEVSRELLDLAAQSQTALKRGARWLASLGALVFDALEMRIELASSAFINESSEADLDLAALE